MAPRYFTVQEANDLLPTIVPLMDQLLERRARVVAARKEIGGIIEDLHSNVGGATASQLVRDFAAIERLMAKIQSYGCVVKDMNTGLLDFLAERNGREVYLCWRHGEPRVAFYHELHTGFNGRRPLEE
ncbi:MAG TPA: DUF2203 domain-containing protein [Candidatus Sulfomarinibacteraceae bacterium]|nr:DUF2203 domain-containing protein [Candidatus Sulfomarinibacteraceae bacterium]